MNLRLRTRTTATLAGAALLALACGADDEAEVDVISTDEQEDTTDAEDGEDATLDDGDPTAPSDTTAAPEEVDDPNTDDEQPAGDDGGSEDEGSEDEGSDDDAERDEGSSDDAGFDPVALDIVERHPHGLVIELHEVRSTGSSLELDMRVVNGQDLRIFLNHVRGRSELRDDTGAAYPMIPPEGDQSFELDSGEIVEATISFAGPLTPSATSLVLEFNPEGADDEFDDGPVTAPHVVIEDIPLTQD